MLRWSARWIAQPAVQAARQLLRALSSGGLILEVVLQPLDTVEERLSLVQALRRVGDDPLVRGLWVRVAGLPGGWATLEEVRGALALVRAAGKRVEVSLEETGNGACWLASAADQVHLAPEQELHLVGLGTQLPFLAGALERWGVEVEVEAAGAFKSAGEVATRRLASPANLEATHALLEDLQRRLIQDVAEGRRLAPAAIEAILQRAPLSAQEALAAGLVDGLSYDDQVRSAWKVGFPQAQIMDFRVWAGRDRWLQRPERWAAGPKRLVIVPLQGAIVDETEGSGQRIRPSEVLPVLRALAEDDQVVAVVLRVDSPGGSAQASDLLWRAVQQVRLKKPIVASFGDVAASGGVYLAAGASAIVGCATTLTGSVGVVGGKVNLGRATARQGLVVQEVLAAPHATWASPFHRFSPDQRERFRRSLDHFYEVFVQRVADGRGRDPREVEPFCRGRVWSGSAAQGWGLLDRVGGLDEAVRLALELAGARPEATRVDLAAPSGGGWRAWLQKQIRRSIPLGAQLSAVTEGWEGADLLLTHPNRPLAWWPTDPRPGL